MALNLDLLDLFVIFENLSDFFEQAVGFFLNGGLVGCKEDLVFDFDLVGGNDNTSWNAAILIGTLLIRALIETLAAEFGFELAVVNPLIAVTVAIRIGSRATIVLFVTSDIGAGILGFADVGIGVEQTLVGDPGIADFVAIVIGIGAAIVIFEAVIIFGFVGAHIGALANIGIAIGNTLLGNPRIADTIGINIGIRATIDIIGTGQVGTIVDALADVSKRIAKTTFGNPGIANGVTVRIGSGATKEFFAASDIGAIIDIIQHAVAIAVGNHDNGLCIVTKAETDCGVRAGILQFVGINLAPAVLAIKPGYVSSPGFSRPNSL